jgi:hypothetical protein
MERENRYFSDISRIGSFDCPAAKGKIERTFHGSRFRRGPCEVNQSISSSLDQATLMCVTCEKSHSVLGNNPTTVFISDQNFVEYMPGVKGNLCLSVIRMEDATLPDLGDLALKVFDGHAPQAGSALLIGSASFLHRAGLSAYALAWTSLVETLSNKWKSVKVCPLIPIIREDCPGSLARELQELASWMISVYQGSSLGFSESWSSLSAMLAHSITSDRQFGHVER